MMSQASMNLLCDLPSRESNLQMIPMDFLG